MMSDPATPVDLTVTVRRFRNGDVYKAVAKCCCGAWAHLAVGSTPHLSALEWLTEHVREAHPTSMPDSRPLYGTVEGEGYAAMASMRQIRGAS